MKKTATRRILALAMCLIMAVSALPFAGAAGSDRLAVLNYEKLQDLIAQRAELVGDENAVAELAKIDKQIQALGGRFVDSQEVRAMVAGETIQKASIQVGGIYLPDSPYNTWIVMSYPYKPVNVQFEVLDIVCQPNDTKKSSLLAADSQKVTYSSDISIAGNNLLKTLVKDAAGATITTAMKATGAGGKYIAVIGGAVSLLSAMQAFLSNISSSSAIVAPHISYSWSSTTTVHFMYVKSPSTDYMFTMEFMQNTTLYTFSMPSFSVKNIGSISIVAPEIVAGSGSIITNTKPAGYTQIGVPNYIVAAYDIYSRNVANKQNFVDRKFIQSVELRGPVDKLVKKLNLPTPYNINEV